MRNRTPGGMWRRRAAAWLSALVLCLSGIPPLPVLGAAADSFVAANICSAGHGAAGETGGHDCRDHCCLATAKAPPPPPVVVAPSDRLIEGRSSVATHPAPPSPPRPQHAPRAPPVPVV